MIELAKKAGVCAICGERQGTRHENIRGLVCNECDCLDKLEDLRMRVSKRVDGTYNRLNAFKELGLLNETDIVADIEECLGFVEESLKNKNIQIGAFKSEIVSNFERVSVLETTLISANLIELTNKMPQANVITLRDENEKFKKQTEKFKKDNEELKDKIDNLINEIERSKKNRPIPGNDININAINEYIRSSFKRIKENEDSGLLKIYEPYDMKFKCQGTNRLASDDFTREVKNMLDTEEDEIKICGLSLRLFFNSDHGKFFTEIRNAFIRMGKTGKPIVKILMLYPKSDWKVLRQSVEDKYTTPGQKLETNLGESIAWLNENIEQHEIKNKDKILKYIRFYDATPDFFLFITSHSILFEIYHMGLFQLKQEENKDLLCLGLGGHVPVFKFDKKSPMYNYLSAHFDYYFEEKIDGEQNPYHKGTLKEWLAKDGSIKETSQE